MADIEIRKWTLKGFEVGFLNSISKPPLHSNLFRVGISMYTDRDSKFTIGITREPNNIHYRDPRR